MPHKRAQASQQSGTLFGGDRDGPLIGKITPRATDPNMRAIRVGRKTVAVLLASDVLALKLNVGDSWTDALSRRVARAQALHKARKAAMNMLGRRPYSQKEIVNRLVSNNHDRDLAEQIGQELTKSGWINDASFADAVIHQVTRSRPAGRSLIRHKLQSRGIAETVIQQTLAGTDSTSSELTKALALARTRLVKIVGLPNLTIRRRIASLLTRRGFDDDTIEQVMDRLKLSARESD